MKEFQNKIKKTILVILIIMALTLGNFIAIGMEFISFAVGDLEVTNENNILFKAIFVDNKGDEYKSLNTNMSDRDIKLRLAIQVKKEGYFNGEIHIQESNFILNTNIEDKYINQIEKNYIKLNQINAGQEVTLDIGIEIVKEEQYKLELLDKTTNINLVGSYIVGENNVKQINSTAELQLKLNPEISEKTLESKVKVVTNKVYKINEENKRVLQFELATRPSKNDYPIKETKIEVDVIEGTERIEVAKRGTYATNNNKGELESNWNKETNKVEITILNPEVDGKIEWNKNKEDKILITYILKENAEVLDKQISLNNRIQYFDKDNSIIEAKLEIVIEGEKDGAIYYALQGQKELYKGNLYYGEESSIETETIIDIRLKNLVEDIKISEGNAKYISENEEFNANLNYYSTSINKEVAKKVLGETGRIIIKTKEGKILGIVNKETIEKTEEENIEIKYENQTEILLEVDKAQNEGELVFLHKQKLIEDVELKDLLKKVKKIKLTGSLSLDEKKDENLIEKIIELKEPESYAKITSSTNSLSTLQTNENIEFNVILKTDDIKYDLYKNPTIELQFPSEITNIKATFNTVFLDGMQVKEANIYDTAEGNKAMKVVLEGEQTQHSSNLSEGIILNLNANIDVLKNVNTKTTEIKMLYTNENSQENIYEKKLPIELKSKEGLLVYNKVENYNSKGDVIEAQGTENVNEIIDIGSKGKEIKGNTFLVNNYPESLEKVTIVGKNADNTTMDLKLIKSIEVNKASDLYYSENGEAWTQNIDELKEVKAYKIETDQIPATDTMFLKYDYKLPEELGYNQIGKIEQKVTYTYQGQELTQDFGLQLKTENVSLETTEVIPEEEKPTDEVTGKVQVETTTRLGMIDIKEEDKVHEGETLKNIIKISNKTGKDLKNVKVKVKQENAVLYDLKEKKVFNYDISDEERIEHSFEELETSEKNFDTIETIKSGEVIQLAYEVVVKKVEGTEKETYGDIEISADDMKTINTTTIRNKIEQGELKLNSKFSLNEEVKQYANFTAPTTVNISNIGERELQDVNVEIQFGALEIKDLEALEFFTGDLEEFDRSYIRNLKYDSDTKIVTFQIYKLFENQNIKVMINTTASKMDLDKTEVLAGIVTTATTKENEVYTSNVALKKTIQTAKDITVKQESDVQEGRILQNGDSFNIKVTVENNTDHDNELNIENNMSNMLKINKIDRKIGEEIVELDKKYYQDNNIFNYDFKISAKSKVEFLIKVTVNSKSEDKEVTSQTKISYKDSEYEDIYSKELSFLIGAYEIPDDDDDNNNGGNSGNTVDKNKEYEISGIAWLDKNKNGKLEDKEERLSGIQVKLANKVTGEIISDWNTTTDKDGKYKFKVKNGEYIVIFQYDTKKYNLTEYKKAGVTDKENSDVISKSMKIGEVETLVGITDTIKVLNGNVKNISIGLIEKEVFDLRLDKTVSKISIQNKQGTSVYQYNNEKLAKLEIKAKYYKGTSVVIEYKIAITNEGEVEGYANEIIDFIPAGLKFNSELNKNWYMAEDGKLNSTSLSNQKILPGETKEITLLLTKTLDENDGGLISNTAEIYKSSNDKNIEDKDSIAGNKLNGEDDISTAGVIISIGTGIVKICVITIFVGLVIAGIVVYIIKRKGGELFGKSKK